MRCFKSKALQLIHLTYLPLVVHITTKVVMFLSANARLRQSLSPQNPDK